MRFDFILWLSLVALSPGYAVADEAPAAAEAPATVDAPVANETVSRILGELSWGATLSDVLKDAEKRLTATWQNNLKELDTIGVDKMRRRMRSQFETIKGSLVRFDVGTTGFESTIVDGEMLVGKNESLLQIPFGAQQRYYFFRNDRLWKIVVIRDAAGTTDLEVFIKRLNEDLASEATITFAGKGKERAVATAEWRDDKTLASAHDQTSFFNAYLVRFIQIGDGETYQSERGNKKHKVVENTDSDLNDLFAEGDANDDETPNVVDQMTGSAHDVDLNAGRMEYNPLTATPDTSKKEVNKRTKKKPAKSKPKAKIQKKNKKLSDSDDIIY